MLNDIQRHMIIAGKFHVDGWTSSAGRIAADDLLKLGYVTCFESGSDDEQSTVLNYTVTDAGRAAIDL